MTQTANEIVVGANGSIRVAPVGTAAPTDPTTAYGAGWIELGFATEAGVKLHDGKTLQEIKVWQSFYAVRRIITARDFTVGFGLVQWNDDTVPLAFGGGAITSPSAGVFRFAPPPPQTLDERSLAVDWQDGTKNYRLIVPRGIIQDSIDVELTRTKESMLPLVFGLTTDGSADPFYFLTDDPAWS